MFNILSMAVIWRVQTCAQGKALKIFDQLNQKFHTL